MRIVKKTLKGDLLGKTGFKKVAGAARPKEGEGEAQKGPAVRTRGAARLDDVVPEAEDLVIVSEPLHPRPGTERPNAARSRPAARDDSPEARQAAAEAEADLAATSGYTASSTGGRGLVTTLDAHAQPTKPVAGKAERRDPPAAATGAKLGTRLEGDAASTARNVLAEALFRAFGQPGSKIQEPRGASFQVAAKMGSGIVRSQHDLLLPLPAGHVTPHAADIVIELEPTGLLVLDIVPSSVTLQDLKARAFDALQMRRLDRCFSVLVFVRCPGAGMAQGQAEAITHGYDLHFGIDEEHVHSEAKFTPLRQRITNWLEAASSANRGMR